MSFNYFAFGSNLLLERMIAGGTTTAKFTSIAKLIGYRLIFTGFSKRWQGALASIEPSESDHVWGVYYTVDNADKANLDDQEGVDQGIYRVETVSVVTPGGESVNCRTYIFNHQSSHLDERYGKPSPYYKGVILHGALISHLPDAYVQTLRHIPDNGYRGSCCYYENVIECCNSKRELQETIDSLIYAKV